MFIYLFKIRYELYLCLQENISMPWHFMSFLYNSSPLMMSCYFSSKSNLNGGAASCLATRCSSLSDTRCESLARLLKPFSNKRSDIIAAFSIVLFLVIWNEVISTSTSAFPASAILPRAALLPEGTNSFFISTPFVFFLLNSSKGVKSSLCPFLSSPSSSSPDPEPLSSKARRAWYSTNFEDDKHV